MYQDGSASSEKTASPTLLLAPSLVAGFFFAGSALPLPSPPWIRFPYSASTSAGIVGQLIIPIRGVRASRSTMSHPRDLRRSIEGAAKCQSSPPFGPHSGLSSLPNSALASAVAFSTACSRVMVLELNRRETRLSQ